jgi:radical SAM superfamily enzyme YgiQ (UPF0313 family)
MHNKQVYNGRVRTEKKMKPEPRKVRAPRRADLQLIQPLDKMTIAVCLERYAAPVDAVSVVTLIRPFIVQPRRNLSVPTALPLGPAYLGATLEAAGYTVRIVDAVGEGIADSGALDDGLVRYGSSPEEIVQAIDPRSRIIGVSCMFSAHWLQHRALIEKIRLAFPSAVIVAGGEHVTALPEFTLRDCSSIDYVVTGEGELTLLRLCHATFTNSRIEDIAGVHFIDDDGTCCSGGLSLRVTDFGNLPRPAWHLVDLEAYRNALGTQGIDMGFSMPLLATRGCPFQCTFCSNPAMWTLRYMMRDPVDVVDEVEDYVRRYGLKSVMLCDLTAFTKKRWILDLCAELERREVFVDWQMPSGTRSEALDEETLKALYRINCRSITYAPESGSPTTLAAIKKEVDLDKLIESIESALAIGFHVKANIVLGFPSEGHREIIQTLRFVMRLAALGVDDCAPWIFSPYPGSELYVQLAKAGKVDLPGDSYFQSLYAITDFRGSKQGLSDIPPWQLNAYRVLLTLGFYAVAYGSRPRRIVALVKGLWSGDYQAANFLEQRLGEAWQRALGSRPKVE